MNIFTRTFNRLSSSLRSLSTDFSTADPKLSRSIVFNLATRPNPDDRYTGLVFACVDAITAMACQAKPMLMHYDDDGNATRDFDNDLIKILYKPNSQQTWHDLVKWTVGYREVFGNAYWYIAPPISGRGNPVGIYVLDPSRMSPVYVDEATPSTQVAYWEYTTNVGGYKLRFTPEEIISFPYFSPYSQIIGIGSMQAAHLEQDNDLAAQNFVSSLYQNGAMPSGVLSSDQQLTDQTVERVRSDWKRTYEGTANIGKTLILEQGLKYERLSLSQEDMAFYEGRRDARDAILQIFRVPRSLLGSSQSITRANAEADIYSFAKNKIQPMMDDLFNRLNYYLLPKFGLNPVNSELKFKPLVPEDRELELKENDTYLKDGVLTINEVRSRKRLEAVEWGDQPFQLPQEEVITDTTQETARQLVEDAHTRAYRLNKKEKAYVDTIDKELRSLVRQYTREVEKTYDEAAEIITEHLTDYWVTETRSLSAQDLRAVTRAMPGELDSIMPTVENLIMGMISRLLTAGVYRTAKVTLKYLVGTEGDGMYLSNPRAVDFILQNGLKDASSISKTMKKIAQRVVSDAIIEGWNVGQLGEALQKMFKNMTGWKAEQIARTELHKAMAFSSFDTANSTGMQLEKRWVTAEDDRVCEHCKMNADVGYIPLSDAFPHGELSPQDEHPNGRCVLVYRPVEKPTV